MNDTIRSIDGVCNVQYVHGAEAPSGAIPDLLLEVPHGATLAQHFLDLRGSLVGDVAADLIDFFFVNTDVGAPELARAVAERVVELAPKRSALVVQSLLPRTLIDCNRCIDPSSAPTGSAPGQLTPGLPLWIRDPVDQRLLLRLHSAYREVAAAAFAAVCGNGGFGLMVHTYAPRSLDVPVDEHIVEHLRAAYEPERIGEWPLRAEVDLITHDPEGQKFAPPELVASVVERLESSGRQVDHNGTYSLHPLTLAHEFAVAYPGRTLCFEVRRDLLVPEFIPFRELHVDAERVARIAEPFALAITAQLS